MGGPHGENQDKPRAHQKEKIRGLGEGPIEKQQQQQQQQQQEEEEEEEDEEEEEETCSESLGWTLVTRQTPVFSFLSSRVFLKGFLHEAFA